MNSIYKKEINLTGLRKSITTIYNDFTGEYVLLNKDNEEDSCQITSEECYKIVRQNNLQKKLSSEGLLKFSEFER